KVVDFCHLSGNNPQCENSMCNECSERLKNKPQEKKIVITPKKAKHETAQINITSKNPNANNESSSMITSSSFGNIPNNSIIIPDDFSIIFQSNFSFIQNDFSIILPNDPNITQNDSSVILLGNSSITQDNHSNMIIPSDSNNIILNNLRITIPKVPDNIVFTNIVSSNSSNITSSYFIVSDIDNNIGLFSEKDFGNLSGDRDLKTIEKRFCQLANILIVLLESDSGYYWEIRKLYLNSRKKAFSELATDGQLPKRRSEAHAPISRYNCIGNIRLTIIPEQQYALIKESHKQQKNVYNGPNKPTLIGKAVLEATRIHRKAFKILNYLENNFVRTLGFLTPLIKHIGVKNITEIVIDSIFKTNQERFEFFAVNVNCGEYGMPIAYLYLSILDASIANNSSMSNSVEDGNFRLRSLSNMLVEENFDITKERQENFDALMMPFLKEINLCKTALQSCNQQATSKSKGKLTFWLC
ncbi:6440_t:CDS:2, partial [Cetraspora pellucida]